MQPAIHGNANDRSSCLCGSHRSFRMASKRRIAAWNSSGRTPTSSRPHGWPLELVGDHHERHLLRKKRGEVLRWAIPSELFDRTVAGGDEIGAFSREPLEDRLRIRALAEAQGELHSRRDLE